jgi:hypothetical protein
MSPVHARRPSAVTPTMCEPAWRVPIGLYSLLEKAFMVWLVLFNAKQPFVAGFWLPFAVDLSVVVFTIGYFMYCGIGSPLRDEPDRRG